MENKNKLEEDVEQVGAIKSYRLIEKYQKKVESGELI